MVPDLSRLLAHLHGHLGILAVALLLHPVVALRREVPRGRVLYSVVPALVITSAAAILGMTSYADYRAEVQVAMYRTARPLAIMFERKEHFGFAATAFVWCGGLLLVAGRENSHRRAARIAFSVAFGFAALAGVIGIWAATVKPVGGPP